MQEVWEGKGDHKLIYKRNEAGLLRQDIPSAILKQYGCICDEEKFTVLPYDVRMHIANIVKGWVEQCPVERTCVGDSLTGSLTLMAHGTYQIYLSFERFLNCRFDDVKILKILRCYKNCVPEPGTYFGEIVAQFFQHCKQQTNLNVKRTVVGGGNEEKTKQLEQNIEIVLNILKASLEMKPNSKVSDGEDGIYNLGLKRESPTADMDRKFEVIMSLKRAATVELMFVCTQERVFPDGTNGYLEHYLRQKVFGTLLKKEDGEHLLDKTAHEFSIKQYKNTPTGEIYFSLTICRKKKYDEWLDNMFMCVDIHNESVRNGVRHRLGLLTLVYCSDTLYFMGMSKRLFIDNSVTFLYCFLTANYRPVVETKEDSFIFGLVKIISSIEYFTKCSLKRNHNGKMGYGPLSCVISEGGLNESNKFVNNLFRDTLMSEQNCPHDRQDLSIPSTSTPPSADTNSNVVNNVMNFVINEPYINTFLNRPVECGSMY